MKWNIFFEKHKNKIKPFSRFANYGAQVKPERREKVLDLLDTLIEDNDNMIIYAVYEVDGDVRLSVDLPDILNGDDYSYYKKIKAISKLENYINQFL
jgi:hypothetical protein